MRRIAIVLAVLVMPVLLAGCATAPPSVGAGPTVLPSRSAVPTGGDLRGQVNGHLAFQRGNEIYTIWPDGSGLKALTATPNHDELRPKWNPTGTLIAFWRAAVQGGPGSIWTMNCSSSCTGIAI